MKHGRAAAEAGIASIIGSTMDAAGCQAVKDKLSPRSPLHMTVGVMPPSTRKAVPLVAAESGLAT
jgi:hypothetical protein